MSLADKFQKMEPSYSGLPCGIQKLLETMSQEDAKTLEDAMFTYTVAGKRISNTKIYEILTEEGHSIAPSAIAQHRRKQCRCFVGAKAKIKDAQ